MEKELVVALDRAWYGDPCLAVRAKVRAMSNKLFGTDGVRGIAGQYPLDKAFIRKLGAAAAAEFRKQAPHKSRWFLLGRDTRGSGRWIARAFAEGAATERIRLHDAGVVSTPSLAHLVPKRHALGGVMISASHNPAAFNGIKLFGPDGRKCPDSWEQAIEAHALESTADMRRTATLVPDRKAVAEYLRFVTKSIPHGTVFRGMKLVVDCSNGSLSKIAPAFFRRLGIRVIPIGHRPNGLNINAGIGSQHPEKMAKLVRAQKADGGIAFDGDADRVIFCDEKGQTLDGDHVLACAARCLHEDGHLAKATVVVTIMANLGFIKALEGWGIKAVATPVGDRFVSDALQHHGASVGGEQSGHIIFSKYLPTGDGLLTSLQILSMLRRRNLPLSWMHSLFQKYPQVLVNLDVKRKTPLDQCAPVQASIEKAKHLLGNQGRVVVRYSGTEPLLRIMMEGPDKTQLEGLCAAIADKARTMLC